MYQVYHGKQISMRSAYEWRQDYLFVAMSTLMFPLGSNPSSWLINSNIVRWTSLSPPAPSSNRVFPTTPDVVLTQPQAIKRLLYRSRWTTWLGADVAVEKQQCLGRRRRLSRDAIVPASAVRFVLIDRPLLRP